MKSTTFFFLYPWPCLYSEPWYPLTFIFSHLLISSFLSSFFHSAFSSLQEHGSQCFLPLPSSRSTFHFSLSSKLCLSVGPLEASSCYWTWLITKVVIQRSAPRALYTYREYIFFFFFYIYPAPHLIKFLVVFQSKDNAKGDAVLRPGISPPHSINNTDRNLPPT